MRMWDEASKAAVKSRWADGASAEAIAADFGVTEMAIKRLINRNKFVRAKQRQGLIARICQHCKSEFVDYHARRRICCSIECSRAFREARVPKLVCATCGKTCRKGARRRFCSHECAGKGSRKYSHELIAKIRAAWMKGHTPKRIAKDFNISYSALCGISDRNGFPPHQVVLARLRKVAA